jgi:hypothetical protein
MKKTSSIKYSLVTDTNNKQQKQNTHTTTTQLKTIQKQNGQLSHTLAQTLEFSLNYFGTPI